jgi:predicted nucleic acid-binding Zn ribbon protein
MKNWAESAVAEWRCYREGRDTSARATTIRGALAALLPKLGLADAMDEQAVRRAWADLVGPFIAAQSVPDRIRNGVLHVQVHQSSVRFELERTWKAEITRKLAAEFGAEKIREVKFFG